MQRSRKSANLTVRLIPFVGTAHLSQVLTLFPISPAGLEDYYHLHFKEKAIEGQEDESPVRGRPAGTADLGLPALQPRPLSGHPTFP